MPTREVQRVIETAKNVAVRYALIKRSALQQMPRAIVHQDGYTEMILHEPTIDMTEALDTLVEACADLVS